MSRFLLLVLLTKISFCQTTGDKEIFQKAGPEDSLSFYFPAILNDTFVSRNPVYRNFKQNWYSSALYSFKEPILFNKKASQPVFRLLWLRSFNEPVCFSITCFNGRYYLNTKILDHEPAFYPTIYLDYDKSGKKFLDTVQKADRLAHITYEKIMHITEDEWFGFEEELAKINFWEKPIADPDDEHTTDGSNWILEGLDENRYHFLDRRNANTLKDCGKYLIKLSGINIPERDIY